MIIEIAIGALAVYCIYNHASIAALASKIEATVKADVPKVVAAVKTDAAAVVADIKKL